MGNNGRWKNPHARDRVEFEIDTTYFACWRCRNCRALTYEQDTHFDTISYKNVDPDQVADEAIDRAFDHVDLLEDRVNAGKAHEARTLTGKCKSCGTLQPWGKAAFDKEMARKVTALREDKILDKIVCVIALIAFFASPLAIILSDRDFGKRLETMVIVAGCAVGVYLLAVASKFIRVMIADRNETRIRLYFRGKGTEKMLKNGEADCLPLIAATRDTLELLPPDDERVKMLDDKMPDIWKLDSHIKYKAWDCSDPDEGED